MEEFRGNSTAGSRPKVTTTDQRSKMEGVMPKMAAREAQMRDNPEGELDPADDDRRRCKKNVPSKLTLACLHFNALASISYCD